MRITGVVPWRGTSSLAAVAGAIGLALLIAGCVAYTPRAAQMVPEIEPARSMSSSTRVRVLPVKGGENPTSSDNPFDGVKLDDQSFQQALEATLRRARIFEQVMADGDADYELHAAILGQQSRFGREVGSMTATLLVAYRLVDTRTGRAVWKENLLSQSTATRGSGPSTPANESMGTMMVAYEGAVKDSFGRLVQRLAAAVAPAR